MNKLRTLLLLGALALGLTASAQVPQLLNYQGRVAVGTTNFNGSGAFKFALVNTNGTTAYWTNDGTHLDGTEPTAAVTLNVTKGLYSVLLGDTTVANMTAIPATVWANADVRLRVWFNDGPNGSKLLSPDQRLAPNGYIADGSVSSAAIAPGAITSAQIAASAVTSAQIAGSAVTAAKIASGAINNAKLANNAVQSANIAAGAITSAKLDSNIIVTSTNGYGLGHKEGTHEFSTYIDASGVWIGSKSNDPVQLYTNDSAKPNMTLATNGYVGIGTFTPHRLLDVNLAGIASNGIRLSNADVLDFDISPYEPADYSLTTPATQISVTNVAGWTAHMDFKTKTWGGDGTSAPLSRIHINGYSGNVGIGTTTPTTKLDVNGEVTCVAINLTSDRNAKEQFKPVNAREVLDKVIGMPITEWQYKEHSDARHIGPMAQDFREAFALGHDDKHITSVDADGVALAAIQGLNEKLEAEMKEKDAVLTRIKQENHTLTERLKAIESRLGIHTE